MSCFPIPACHMHLAWIIWIGWCCLQNISKYSPKNQIQGSENDSRLQFVKDLIQIRQTEIENKDGTIDQPARRLRRCSSGTSIGWIVHPLVYLQIPSHIAERTTVFAALAHSAASEALWKNAPEKRVIDNRTCSFNPLNLLQISHVPKAPCPPIVYQPGRSDMQCKDQESRKNSNLRKLLLQGQPDPT